MSTWGKYASGAETWSEAAYADPRTYLARRAMLVRRLGPVLEPGDTVLDLACGDAGIRPYLPEQRYIGVDASPAMIEAAKRHGHDVIEGDLNNFEPAEPVQATTIFRAIYYVRDRPKVFARIAGYTEKKLVFDLNPRQYRVAELRADLRAAGFDRLDLRPFFVPQTVVPAMPIAQMLRVAERAGPLAVLMLRARFTYMCSAFRSGAR